MINKQLAPYTEFPRITRIEDLEPLEVNRVDYLIEFPEIFEKAEGFPEWLECEDSIEETVANNIEDTMRSIHESLVYKRKYTK